MKRYLRVGERYALSKRKPIYLTIKYFSLLAVLSLMCLYAAKQASAQQAEPAAPAVADIKPIEKGSSIPDGLWNAPLTSWTATNNRTETITLDDYRGKVIILDFWATWCKSCIANMPRMHELQSQFQDDAVVLPVTYESTEIVDAVFTRTKKSPILDWKEEVRSILNDSLIKAAFPNPNGTIPYFALIGRDGLFQGSITPIYLTNHLISQLIEGNKVEIPRLRHAPVEPLMDWSFSDNDWQLPVSYHTMLSGYIHGAGEPAKLKIDSAKDIQWEYYINQPLIRLFGIALKSPLPGQANRRIMLVDSAMRFDAHNLRNPAYNPFLYNYCYEAIHPIGTPMEKVRAQLLVNLN